MSAAEIREPATPGDTIRAEYEARFAVTGTHYEDCWQTHPLCALVYALDALTASEQRVGELEAALERLERAHECCWHDPHGHGALGECAFTRREWPALSTDQDGN